MKLKILILMTIVRINLIIMLFISTVINAQTTTYTIKKKQNVKSNQSTYEVKRTNDLATKMINHSKNLSSIRRRVRAEMSAVVSEGQKSVMNLKPGKLNNHTSKLLFMAQDIAFEEIEKKRKLVTIGMMHKNYLPKAVNEVVLKYSKLITALDIIGGIEASKVYQKSLSYIDEVNNEFEVVLNGAIYNEKIKLLPLEMVQYVQDSYNGNLKKYEDVWLEESLLVERYEDYRENILAQRSKHIAFINLKKDVRKFISKEIDWAKTSILYYGIKKRHIRKNRLPKLLEELNFSKFFERSSGLSDRKMIIDYVNFMNSSTSVNYKEF